MEIVKECGTSILSTIVEDLVKSTGRQVGYIFRFKSIIEDLNEEAENLRLAQENMQHRVDGAIKDREEIEKDVEKWLRDVTAVVTDAEDLEKQTREKKTCLNGLCPNWIWRYQMARRAQKKISTLSKLKDGGNFDEISRPTTLSGINVLPQKDFMLFESTTSTFNLIIEALKDDKTNVVGLYGMGGVGKTTLAKAVVNKAKEEKIFNEVVMVAVSQTPNIRGIQGQIADQLNLELEEESVESRAERLYMRFKNEKKILIILDDIWEKIDLAIIGIPVDDRHKDCKIFLTTRQKQVCIDMGCQSRIPLDVLNEEEGLILFKRHSGLNDDQSPTMIKLAKEVVKECKGLPLAIVAIGSALKEQPIGEWETATQKLRKSKLMDVDIVDEKLYACLKLSYDYLKNEKTKSCFLLCSLFPEDHEIDMEQLVRYGLGLGLYQNTTDSVEEARRELCVMVNRLKASSLLLDAEEGYVKMHDVVRDVALWITSKGEEVFMVKAGMGLTEWPKHEGLEQCTSISLMGNKIEVLPDGLVCPKLKILLEILNLKGSKFVELPEELGELGKLRMLDITRCRQLKRIPANVIPRLSRLEELYIVSSSFEAWEVEGTSAERSNASLSELYQLNHLTILSLNINVQPYLSKDFVLPTKLLRYDIRVNDDDDDDDDDDEGASYPKSRLLKIRGIETTSLVAFKALYEKVEYLKLVGIEGCCQNMVPSIDETGLNELKRLSLRSFDELECIVGPTQQVSLQSLTVVKVAFCPKLRYLFTLSLARSLLQLEQLSVYSCGSLEHIVEIKEAEENVGGGGGNDVMFPKLRILQLDGLENFINFYSENSSLNLRTAKEQLQNLEELEIHECRRVQVLFQLEGIEQELSLPSLKVLKLEYLKELECLCKGPTHLLSLPNLKKLEVYGCNRLRHMFSPSLARNMLQLEELIIWHCGELEYIVSIKAEENVGGGGGNDVMLPKLRILQLHGLENFINFFDSENLSLNMQTTKKQLRGLRHGFPNLEVLFISECRVQVLFHLEGLEQELAFPSLKVLDLSNLEELECLCKGPTHLLSLPNLKKLEVSSCKKLRHMFSPSLARNLLQLEELIIRWCDELEYIVSIKAEENVGGGGGNDVMLPKLRILKLCGLENFINFFDSENLSLNVQTSKKQLRGLRHGFPNLEELYINECRVQVLFHLEGLEQELAFPSLKVLDLSNLEELECLCKGPTHLLSLPNLKKLRVYCCKRPRHMFSPSLARNLLQLEELSITYCWELEYIVSIKAEENVGGGGGNDVMLPKLRMLQLVGVKNFINFFDSENLSLNVHTTKKQLRGLRHGFPNLEELYISECRVQVLFHLEGLEQELAFPSLKVLELYRLKELEWWCKGPTHLLSLPNLKRLGVYGCDRLRYMFSPSLARNLLQLEELIISWCDELEYIVSIKAEKNVGGGGGNDVMLSKLRILRLSRLPNFIDIYSENSSLNVQTVKKQLQGLRHGLQSLEELKISRCRVQVLFHLDGLEQELAFPSLKVLYLEHLKELECLCKGPTHLLSLPKLKELSVYGCNRLRHMFSPSLARNFMQLEELIIEDCGELEQIFIEDDAAEYHPTLLKDHLQWPLLFPNLSSISIKGCDKLKTLFPAVTTARSGLQKLKTLIVGSSSQLEELFGHKDEADMTSDREMVLPQLQKLTLQGLASLVNFCPVGYHFIFPSLSRLFVTKCPKITTRFSIDQNRSVHAEAEAPQTGKEDVDMEQSSPETTKEIECWDFDDLQSELPPYIGK